jgi:DNA-binding transcriptional MerR regulator
MRTYTPAEAAGESGFSLDTLRYYEREGILPDVARTAAGHRVYTESDLGTLGFLRCLRDTGMPISLLRRYGRLCQDESTLPQRIELLEEHERNVAAELAELQARQAQLRSKLDWYRGELSRERTAGSRPAPG